jgi:thiosulfate/3-mercaptopyruvate sulfurtransferase
MEPLIDPATLAARLGAATLLDVRWALGGPPGRPDYLAGHIPGAVYVDLDSELAAPPGPGGRHPLPPAAGFQAAMRRAGVSGSRPVVVYDAATSVAAARGWWLLRYFGHPDVTVLDGGLRAWVEHGGALQTEVPSPAPGDFVALPGAMPLLDADGAARLAERGTLLDARAPARFRGEQEPVDPVAGHIPGAVNLPGSEVVDEAGRFGELGIRPDGEVGAYCGSGVSAAHLVLALERAGYRAALYVGSWSEWITDPSRPVATGGPAADRQSP